MRYVNRIAVALACTLGLGLATAHAQYGFGRGHSGSGMGLPGSAGHMLGVPGGGWDMAPMVEWSLASLHARLGITPAQEPAWQAYANAVKAQARDMQQFAGRAIQSQATTPQRMAAMAEFMHQQAESASQTAEAMAALYAVLTPGQRTLLDRGAGWCGNPGPFGC